MQALGYLDPLLALCLPAGRLGLGIETFCLRFTFVFLSLYVTHKPFVNGYCILPLILKVLLRTIGR